MSETTFHITIGGEGQNVAGFPRHLSYSKSYTRSQLLEFAIADQRPIMKDQTESFFEAMDDEELTDWIGLLPELESDIMNGEDFLTDTSWDVRIN